MPKFIPKNNGKKEKKDFLSLKKKKKKNTNKGCISTTSSSSSAAAAAADNNKIDEILEEDRIFQLMPSKTGGVESSIPNTLNQLTEEALSMKKHLDTHPIINANLSQFLLNSLDYVIHMVSRYCNETKLPPFNWETMEFPKKVPKSRLKISSQDVVDNTFKFAENAFKLSECGRVLPDFDSHGIETVKAYVMHF